MPTPYPLKLMFLCGSSGRAFGGAEKNFLQTCRAFHRLGPQKATVTPVVRRNTWLDSALTEDKIPHHTVRFGGMLDVTTKPFLRRLMNTEKPHLVQTWMSRATGLTPKMPGIPFIARLGGYYKRKYYSRADYLVAGTTDIMNDVIHGGWPHDRISLVQNFATLPPEGFGELRAEIRRHQKLSADTVLLFGSNRLDKDKGQATVLFALTRLPDHVHYMVLGGPDEPYLRALAEKLKVAHRVHFMGWVNNFSPLCAAADIFVAAPSVEPLGTVVLDAWAHGLPLVTSDTSTITAMVENGVNALVFPVGDHAALAGRVKLLLAEPALAKGIAEAGYHHVRTHYAENAIMSQYLALYNRLLAD